MGRYQEGFLASAAARGTRPEEVADTFPGVEDMFGEGCRLAALLGDRCPYYACADRPGLGEVHAYRTWIDDHNQHDVGAPHQRIVFAFAPEDS